MKHFVTLTFAIISAGCYYIGADNYDDIVNRPSAEWTSRERMTVIAAVAQSNMQDKEVNIVVSVIPYYPSVITAINRSVQAQKKLTEEEYRFNIASELINDTLADAVRDNTKLLDEKGDFHKDLLELDSLMFYVSLTNKAWPCADPLIENQVGPRPGEKKMVPLFTHPGDVPCPTPNISNLADNIYLANDQDLHLHPKWIWGRRHETLTSDETLLMMFQMRSGSYHFFKHTSKNMKMVIKGFDRQIDLEFPISMVR